MELGLALVDFNVTFIHADIFLIIVCDSIQRRLQLPMTIQGILRHVRLFIQFR
jgi:hypothetical protein